MNKKSKKILLWILDLGLNIAIIFGLVLIIQTWIIAPFDVSGASMCDTLNVVDDECQSEYGEKIIINEALYLFNDPQRGDIVVFRTEDEDKKYFIKRVIGLPGETVEIKDGEVYVRMVGEKQSLKLDEPYLNEENRGKTKTYFSDFSVFEVPEGKYFLLGDNRKASTDSRSCFESSLSVDCVETPEKAFVNRDHIRGKAWVVWWPVKNMRLIEKTTY